MAENPAMMMQFDENEDDNELGSVSEDEIRCTKLGLPDNIVAYKERRELTRDIELVTCSDVLSEKITANYVIVKNIISKLGWQDKMMCKHVCTLWRSIVHMLQKEQLAPADFVISLRMCSIRNGIKFMKSSNFNTEPLIVFTFANTSGFAITSKCEVLVPSPCEPACEKEHYLIDVVNQQVAAPKNCMYTVKASYLSYMPLPTSITSEHIITRQMFARSSPFIGGIYIPKIPNVEFKVINIKSDNQLQKEFYEVVDKLAETRIVKGVLVYVTENYLLHSVEDIVFLNHFKEVQPNIPYALGGCIVEDTISEQSDIGHIVDGLNEGKDYVTENLISIGLFTIPKTLEDNREANPCNFDVYSLIVESSDWAKAKIQSTINEFSQKVPRFEHSVALKLSCIGRDLKHELEQDYFRAAFPNTRLVGCYGNGELGVDHPVKPPLEETLNSAKRHRRDPGPQFGIMYSYSTVFVYIGWGRVLSQPESN